VSQGWTSAMTGPTVLDSTLDGSAQLASAGPNAHIPDRGANLVGRFKAESEIRKLPRSRLTSASSGRAARR